MKKKPSKQKKKDKGTGKIKEINKNGSNYISHHLSTGEIYFSRYNIDFLIFFKVENFLLSLFGSIFGIAIWLLNPSILGLSLLIDLNLLYLIILIGGAGWFLFTGAIVYLAGNSKFESARVAGRRGLFTFCIMMLVTIFALAVTGKITWNQQFYHFLKFFIIGMMATAIFAVPFDYGVAFIRGLGKSKRYDSI